jgi:hypothetical protein
MYQDLRQNFWWIRMKREIAKYVSECDTCQRVKASHLRVSGTLQPLVWILSLVFPTHPRNMTPSG